MPCPVENIDERKKGTSRIYSSRSGSLNPFPLPKLPLRSPMPRRPFFRPTLFSRLNRFMTESRTPPVFVAGTLWFDEGLAITDSLIDWLRLPDVSGRSWLLAEGRADLLAFDGLSRLEEVRCIDEVRCIELERLLSGWLRRDAVDACRRGVAWASSIGISAAETEGLNLCDLSPLNQLLRFECVSLLPPRERLVVRLWMVAASSSSWMVSPLDLASEGRLPSEWPLTVTTDPDARW